MNRSNKSSSYDEESMNRSNISSNYDEESMIDSEISGDIKIESRRSVQTTIDTDGMDIETPEVGSVIFVLSVEEWLLARVAEVISPGDIRVTNCDNNINDEVKHMSLRDEQWLYAKYSGIYVQVHAEDNQMKPGIIADVCNDWKIVVMFSENEKDMVEFLYNEKQSMLITDDTSVMAMMKQLGEAVMLEQLEVEVDKDGYAKNEWNIPRLTKSELEILCKAKEIGHRLNNQLRNHGYEALGDEVGDRVYTARGGTAGNKMPAFMITQRSLIGCGGVKAFNHKLAQFQEHIEENDTWGQFHTFGFHIIKFAKKDPNLYNV